MRCLRLSLATGQQFVLWIHVEAWALMYHIPLSRLLVDLLRVNMTEKEQALLWQTSITLWPPVRFLHIATCRESRASVMKDADESGSMNFQGRGNKIRHESWIIGMIHITI
jgi:hypothetical protein